MTTINNNKNPDHFPDTETDLILQGAQGDIEASVSVPDADIARLGAAIICHPHPLHGGTMHNKVVTMIERALNESGLYTIRFNFRGVGASHGTFDDGRGETNDLLAIAAWVNQVKPQNSLWLAGFSFGAYIVAKASRLLPVKQLITIAPPVGKYAFDALNTPICPWLVVQGEDDDVVSPQAVYDWVARSTEPPTLVRMPGTDHFFHRKLLDLRGAIKNSVKPNLPPLEKEIKNT